MNEAQFADLILQSLEHERAGVNIYEVAATCAIQPDLQDEWEKYLTQTRSHVHILENLCAAFAIDPVAKTPGREVVRIVGSALVSAMEAARAAGDAVAAEIVACECVVLAETKDHLDWELLGKCSAKLEGPRGRLLADACDKVEDEEDEHLYHTRGWCRELWIKALGMAPVLPPPEERHHVKTAIGAARAEQASAKSR